MTTPLEEQPATASIDLADHRVGRAGVLGHLLVPAIAGEPVVGDGVDEVFRRADRLRSRRGRRVLAASAAVVTATIAAGYGLTTVLLPSRTTTPAAPPAAGVNRPDPVRDVLAPVLRASGLRIVPREPSRGDGWRQYVVRARDRPHGIIEVSVYDAPDGLCFPVLSRRGACARPEIAAGTVEYVRYSFGRDADWQVNEVIARRLRDGRTVVLQATGERGTGGARTGRPPLSARQTARLAGDPDLLDAFGGRESCTGPDPACPLLRVPLPVVR